MQRLVLVLVLLSNLVPAAAASASLEKRVAALEAEVATLKEENRKLKKSAFEVFAAQLEERERVSARRYYKNVVLPMMGGLLKDFGSKAPTLPKEDEINTLADAYRPVLEMMAQLCAVATDEEPAPPSAPAPSVRGTR